MKKPDNTSFLFAGNGQYANRGCEAIAKSSIRLIREHFPGAHILNGNEGGSYDQFDETEPDVRHEACTCFPGGRSRLWLSNKVHAMTRLPFDCSTAGRFVHRYAKSSCAVLAMGGDLYGLSWGPQALYQYICLGRAAVAENRPFVIWCATIGRLELEPRLKQLALSLFRRCTLILVREEASLNYLEEIGIRENVKLVADPAFILDPAQPSAKLPITEPLGETIGFNLTVTYGQIGHLGSYRDMVRLGADCVEAIVAKTRRPVLMIPHVVAFPADTCDNDTLFHALVREALADRGLDVPVLPSSLRSWEIKWVLHRLRAYVGSRWHSTVGSFSGGTPTVSIGFSEKAAALNESLLGHTRFVLDCKDLTVDRLVEKLSALLTDEHQIRAALRRRLPEVQERARNAGVYLKEALTP